MKQSRSGFNWKVRLEEKHCVLEERVLVLENKMEALTRRELKNEGERIKNLPPQKYEYVDCIKLAISYLNRVSPYNANVISALSILHEALKK